MQAQQLLQADKGNQQISSKVCELLNGCIFPVPLQVSPKNLAVASPNRKLMGRGILGYVVHCLSPHITKLLHTLPLSWQAWIRSCGSAIGLR